jgi:site-specific recombinase XerD
VKERTKSLTQEEISQYFKTLEETDHEMYIVLVNLIRCTGARIGEIHALMVKNISWETNEIFIDNTKRDGSRVVLMDNDTATALKFYIRHNKQAIEKREREWDRLLEREKKRLDRVMTEEHSQDSRVVRSKAAVVRRELRAYKRKLTAPLWGVGYRHLERIVHKIGERAGLQKDVYSHLWRHIYSQVLHDSGADLVEIQGLLGHKSISTTRGYLLQNRKKEREAYDRAFNQKRDEK